MYKRDTTDCQIDSIYCAELRFRRPIPGQRMTVMAKMVYRNSVTGETFGTCPLVFDSAVHDVKGFAEDVDGVPTEEGPRTMSKEALEALEKFLELAERDLGGLVFERGHSVGPNDSVHAESPHGLRVGLGGQT